MRVTVSRSFSVTVTVTETETVDVPHMLAGVVTSAEFEVESPPAWEASPPLSADLLLLSWPLCDVGLGIDGMLTVSSRKERTRGSNVDEGSLIVSVNTVPVDDSLSVVVGEVVSSGGGKAAPDVCVDGPSSVLAGSGAGTVCVTTLVLVLVVVVTRTSGSTSDVGLGFGSEVGSREAFAGDSDVGLGGAAETGYAGVVDVGLGGAAETGYPGVVDVGSGTTEVPDSDDAVEITGFLAGAPVPLALPSPETSPWSSFIASSSS